MLVKRKISSNKKAKLSFSVGIVHVNSTFNNTIVTITDLNGNIISWSSSGSTGFTGSKKGKPFAAQIASETVTAKVVSLGLRSVKILVKGQGLGCETAIRAVQNGGLRITAIKDINSLPHNGCRPPKKRKGKKNS
jgi:small subunit ribosomal protein S11